ncbi:MAG: ParA family protein [Gammaproteobacteria bacterium]|nr:ParA family protein [Gammaproteobacteria bacterium]HZJ92368.1 ParA family protein [Thiopseudomonas sp.]
MKKVAVISTKGGVGKTTTAVNLAGIAADAGKRVLLLDLDIQPTLSSYFHLEAEADGGIFQLVGFNETRHSEIISSTSIPNLHIIKSNDDQGQLNSLLLNAADGRLRLLRLLEAFKDDYDLVVMDTQGARSVTLEMALLAADTAISPIIPELLAAREFRRGTIALFDELSSYQYMGIQLPELQVFINRADAVTTDARLITENLHSTFDGDSGIRVLDTSVPNLASYRRAASLSMPAHRIETRKPSGRKAPSALETMTALAIEVFPEWADDFQQLTPEKVSSIFDTSTLTQFETEEGSND